MNNITGHTGLTALLGSPVAHSISPLMHNESFRLLGLDYVYLCFDVNEETLPAAVAGLKTCGIRGFNLTMPNKNKIVELLDELSPEAQLIGAVNTVLNDNGKLIGYNTDGYGFMQSVRDAGHDITGKNITVMGVGGASMAICAQSALDGAASVHIFARRTSRYWNRTQKFAENLSAKTGCQVCLFDNDDHTALRNSIAQSYLLINATSVGMVPDIDDTIIKDTSLFRPELVVSMSHRKPDCSERLKKPDARPLMACICFFIRGLKLSRSGPDRKCRFLLLRKNISLSNSDSHNSHIFPISLSLMIARISLGIYIRSLHERYLEGMG